MSEARDVRKSIAEPLAEAASFLNLAEKILLAWCEQAEHSDESADRLGAEQLRSFVRRILELRQQLQSKASETKPPGKS